MSTSARQKSGELIRCFCLWKGVKGEQGQGRNIAFLGFSCYIGRYQETLSTPRVIKKLVG